jgi:hypothetical protein
MTAERRAPGLLEREPGDTDREPGMLPASSILAVCDRLLDEVGRRRHMFAWLRMPGGTAGDWLPVDAYYPRARLVVICQAGRGPHDALLRELIPAHGLGLLMLDPIELGEDPEAVRSAIAAKLFDLEHVPAPGGTPARARGSREDGVRATGSRPDTSAAWTPVKVQRAPVAPAFEQGMGVIVGLALACVLIAEVYLDVVHVFAAGRIVLAFAIALEACSRALGTVAAARAGEGAWACACAIIGAPAVAWFAFLRRSGRAEVEPAPLAGLLAVLAGVLAVVGLLVGS